ncbi:MAG: hypothetical protein RSB29_03690, partial [Alistipes sp.]
KQIVLFVEVVLYNLYIGVESGRCCVAMREVEMPSRIGGRRCRFVGGGLIDQSSFNTGKLLIISKIRAVNKKKIYKCGNAWSKKVNNVLFLSF